MAYQLTPFERETVIIINDEDPFAIIYSSQRPMMTKMDKLCKKNTNTYKVTKEDEVSKTYQCPKNLISFRSEREKRILSDDQKQVLRDRMKNAREKSKVE